MNPGKIWIMRCVRFLLLLMPALAMAMPAFAQVTPVPVLSDSQEKGSLIVFPKFIRGTVALPEGGTAPKTEIEVQVDCPVTITCVEHQPIKIRFHWVCPSSQAAAATVLSAPRPTSTSLLRCSRRSSSPPTAAPPDRAAFRIMSFLRLNALEGI